MTEEMYNILKDFDPDRLNSFIDGCKEQFMDSFNYPQGYKIELKLDKNGDLYTFGPISGNSFSLASYEGNEITLATMYCGKEIDYQIDFSTLNKEDSAKLLEKVQHELFDVEEIVEKNLVVTLEDCIERCEGTVISAYVELFPEHCKELYNIEVDLSWDDMKEALYDMSVENIQNNRGYYESNDI